MKNNNEKWREELMMLLHRITAEYTEWKYAKYLFSPLDDFIALQISQAEQRGDKFGENSKLANQYAQVIQLVYDGVPVDIAEKQIGLTKLK